MLWESPYVGKSPGQPYAEVCEHCLDTSPSKRLCKIKISREKIGYSGKERGFFTRTSLLPFGVLLLTAIEKSEKLAFLMKIFFFLV